MLVAARYLSIRHRSCTGGEIRLDRRLGADVQDTVVSANNRSVVTTCRIVLRSSNFATFCKLSIRCKDEMASTWSLPRKNKHLTPYACAAKAPKTKSCKVMQFTILSFFLIAVLYHSFYLSPRRIPRSPVALMPKARSRTP
ncbi:hypothetical protein K491DRAFT_85893 [Lophiostoma macrostomum CBS 122681]|uniref:Transmembrane protein n=1 Tax=Lophiostoma macrostomum CBS 122681 TaxID=1314788 RepID=A0A6A6SV95_9PLEO|nr:hypothetical protein K491DRAFT_85893 [Lophiostoma macrostomum CBS 122681]